MPSAEQEWRRRRSRLDGQSRSCLGGQSRRRRSCLGDRSRPVPHSHSIVPGGLDVMS